MRIEPLPHDQLTPGTITLIVFGVLAFGAIVTGIVLGIRRQRAIADASKNTGDDGTFFLFFGGLIVAFVIGMVGAVAGETVDDSVRENHYSAELEKVASAYPQLEEANIELSYKAPGFGESTGTMNPVIDNPGEFHPIGTVYERTEDGLDRSNLVAILNDDWSFELFEARDADGLVKIEPQGADQ